MKSCCICGEKTNDNPSIILVNGVPQPICSECSQNMEAVEGEDKLAARVILVEKMKKYGTPKAVYASVMNILSDQPKVELKKAEEYDPLNFASIDEANTKMEIAKKELCSLDGAIFIDGKHKYKGKLSITNKGYCFTSKMNLMGDFDICKIKVTQTVLEIPGLFGSKIKPALRLSIPGKQDVVFAIQEDIIAIAIKKVEEAAKQENLRRKEEDYSVVCRKMALIATSFEAAELSKAFQRLSGYKDAANLSKQCAKIEKDLKEKEQIYDQASAMLNLKLELKETDKLITMLKNLAQYRDSSQLLASATEKRARIVENMYNDACEKMDNAKVPTDAKAAIEVFEQLPNEYKDTIKHLFACRKLLKELQRQEAISQKALGIFNKATTVAEIDEATELFKSISGYYQVQLHIDECAAKKSTIQKRIYDEAAKKLANAKIPSDVVNAIELFTSVESFSDSKHQIAKCNDVKKKLDAKETIYKQVQDKLNSAKTIDEYEGIIKLIDSISGYREVQRFSDECHEKIRKLKEIEEQARREVEEKARLAAEKKAKIDAIENAQTAPDDFSITSGKITSANRKALNLFLDNPFRVLGLARNASSNDAQAVLDKFKKLERLKALGSYSSPFHLKHFAKPDRSAAVIQAAIGTLNDVKNRILWFSTPVGSAAWNTGAYRELTRKLPGIDYDKYDVFLANYIYALLNDPSFANKPLWLSIIKKIITFTKQENSTVSMFEGADNEESFVSLFEKRVSQPIVALIEDAEIPALKNLYTIIRDVKDLETISKKLDSRLSKWFETETRSIDKEIHELGEGENATSTKIATARNLYTKLKSNVKPELIWAENNYPEKSVRLTMFQDEYRGTAWSLMVFLFQAGSKAEARNIADDIEKYCNDEQKDLLKYVIREVPRPRPRPVPPEHEHYDLGWVFIGYGELKIVEVTLNYSANVYLMDDSDFDDYMNCRRFSYYGGRPTQSPYKIKIPNSGHWHLVVDDGPDGLGGISSSARIRTISNSYY